MKKKEKVIPKRSLIFLLKPYKNYILGLAALAVGASGLGLVVPKVIASAIDAYISKTYSLSSFLIQFGALTLGIYIFTYMQSILQTFASEKVAFDLREELSDKISIQNYSFIDEIGASKLLTNLTSDIDAIKMFVGQSVSNLISSVIIIIGAAIFLLTINLRLALAVLLIIPLIGVLFYVIFSKVKVLMVESREVIDWLNKVISESILGSTLIRVLNSNRSESNKFSVANRDSQKIGLAILRLFASLIPFITFIATFVPGSIENETFFKLYLPFLDKLIFLSSILPVKTFSTSPSSISLELVRTSEIRS
jgi:ATP-binding cassette subfamily B protein